MPSPERAALHTLSRRAALGASITVLSGCSLRWEKSTAMPGAKATAAADVAPLLEVRGRLTQLVADTAPSTSPEAPELARAAHARHAAQLDHLDATITSLRGSLPHASPAEADIDWRRTELEWTSVTTAATLRRISAYSRPMATCIAATGIAAAESAGQKATFPGETTFPTVGAARSLAALEASIGASEWLVARRDLDKRGGLPDALTWMYTARSLVQAALPVGTRLEKDPARRFSNDSAAQSAAVTGLRALMPAVAHAATASVSASDISGILLVWSKAVRELERLGSPDPSPFPGMSVHD